MLKATVNKTSSWDAPRTFYLYVVTTIGLITLIIGVVGMINTVVSNYVFKVNDMYWGDPYMAKMGSGDFCSQTYPDPVDPAKMIKPTDAQIAECRKIEKANQEQGRNSTIGREVSIALAQIIVGFPLWLFHWRIVQREHSRKKVAAVTA